MSDIGYGHYTPLRGLYGIVTSKLIWATNIKFLNDEHEFQHALGLIGKIILEAKEFTGKASEIKRKRFIELVDRRIEILGQIYSESVYTLSFSVRTDLLSQWRGYCPASNGYCIVFDAELLKEEAEKHFSSVYFVPCLYELPEKEQKIKDLLNSHWRQFSQENDQKVAISIVDALKSEFLILASYFKHPSFAEENEHRIVITQVDNLDDDIQFREGSFSLVPYVQIPAPIKAIKEIVIGPTTNMPLAKKALETFLEKKSGSPSFFGDFPVRESSIPFRAL